MRLKQPSQLRAEGNGHIALNETSQQHRKIAEAIPTAVKNNSNASKKRGKLLASEDLIITREVVSLRANVAAYETVRQTFENVALRVNQNPHMAQTVNWKSVQDRYKRLQYDFDREDLRNSLLSGVLGDEMGEQYQARSQMREDRASFVDQKIRPRTKRTGRRRRRSYWKRRQSRWRSYGNPSGAQKREARRLVIVAVRDMGMAFLE